MSRNVQILIGDSYLPLLQGLHPGRFVLLEGRRGTGKTRAILTYLVIQALRYPGSRWLLSRSTRALLGRTVLKTLYEQVLPLFGIPLPAAGPANVSEIPIGNGSAFVAEGMNELNRSQSAEYAGGYVAEVGEIEQQDTVLGLTGAMRQVVPGLPFHQVICDVNPVYPGHWANRIAEPAGDELRAIASKADYLRTLAHNRAPAKAGFWKRIITSHADNPGYFDPVAWAWTPVGKEYVEGLGELRGYMRARWLDGLWVAAEGTIFPEFSTSLHVVQPFPIPDDWPAWTFWDPGADHPTAIPWIARAPNGCLYVFDEIYQGGRSVAQHCAEIRSRETARADAGWPLNIHGRYADPQYAFSRTAFSVKTIAEQAAECGIRLEPWPRTGDSANELQMIEAVRGLLAAGRIKTFATCQHTVDEWQSWRWKRKADGSRGDGADEPEDRNNDLMDCIKGAVAQRIHETTPAYTATAATGSPAAAATQQQGWQVSRRRRDEKRPAPRRQSVGAE